MSDNYRSDDIDALLNMLSEKKSNGHGDSASVEDDSKTSQENIIQSTENPREVSGTVRENMSTSSDESAAPVSAPTGEIREVPATGHFTETFNAINPGTDRMLSHFSDGDGEHDDSAGRTVLTPIPKEYKRRKKHRRAVSAAGVLASSLFKAVMYILFVLFVSTYCAYYVIEIGNDIFAFEKPELTANITVTEDMTTERFSSMLSEAGIIKYPAIFNLYIKYKSDSDDTYIPGEYVLDATMNYDELYAKVTTVPYVRTEITVTIPEGYTTDQIIDLFLEKGIGTREGFVEAINEYPFKHDFIAKLNELELDPNRTYRLDGYLFPDTYFFYQDDSEVQVINKLLNNFENKFDDIYYERCERLGMTFDEVITLASMIQAEAKLAVDFEYISSVFHNRLNSDSFPFLESDATVQYCLENRNEDLTQEDLDIDNPYNTYVYEGLPPGPRCNPGIDGITAALYPDDPLDEDGDSFEAFYFVSNKYGRTYYAATNRQHERNKEQVKKDNESYEAAQKPQEESANGE